MVRVFPFCDSDNRQRQGLFSFLFCRTDNRVEDEETIRCLPGRSERRCVGCALVVDRPPLAEPFR